MKTPTSLIMLLAILGVPAAAGAADKDGASSEAAADTSAWQCKFCAYETGSNGYVDAGIGYLSQDSFKFGEYTGLTDKGAYFIGDALYGYRDKNGHYLDLDARNLGLESRSLDLQGGKQGKYELFLNYQELPHFISDSAMTIFNGSGSDNLTLPPGWVPQASLGLMTNQVTGSLQQEDLKTKREIVGLGARFFPGSRWQTTIKGRHETKEGTRAIAGTFFFNSSQFVQPVDYVTDELDVSATYSGQRLQARFAYYGSMFSNSDDSLTWQNPYSPPSPGADAGELALPPDNSFNQLLASIGYQISKKTRLTADLAVGRGEQNDDFLPYTINTTLPGVQPLPRSSLDGKVETINATIKVNSALTERWQFNAAYKYNDRDNQTPQATYNYVVTDSALAAVPATNLPYSYTTNALNAVGEYRLKKNAKASLGFDYNMIERTFQEVEETRDSTLWGKISAMAQENVNVVLQAAYADRSISSYTAVSEIVPPQNPLMRIYNMADRQRLSTALQVIATPRPRVSVGAGFEFASNNYDKTEIGLLNSMEWSANFDASLQVTKKTNVHFFLNHQQISSDQAGSSTFSTPDWTANENDNFNTGGVGVKHRFEKRKIDFGADYVLAASTGEITASGSSFPDLTTTLNSFKVYADYDFKKHLSLNGSIWWEKYDSDNFQLDGVTPSSVTGFPNVLTLGETSPSYDLYFLSLSVRYKF